MDHRTLEQQRDISLAAIVQSGGELFAPVVDLVRDELAKLRALANAVDVRRRHAAA